MTIYDVNVFLTLESPDSEEEVLSGPLSGGFCPTYEMLNNLAIGKIEK